MIVDMDNEDKWHETTLSWPFPISLLSAKYKTSSDMAGDVIVFLVAEDTVIGTITSAVAVDDDEIAVSDTVIANVKLGQVIRLDDGTNNNLMGKVKAIDTSTKKITLTESAENSFAVATPTYVKMSVCMVDNVELDNDDRVNLGDSKIGGSYIPADIVMTAKYKNNSTTARKFRVKLEYLY